MSLFTAMNELQQAGFQPPGTLDQVETYRDLLKCFFATPLDPKGTALAETLGERIKNMIGKEYTQRQCIYSLAVLYIALQQSNGSLDRALVIIHELMHRADIAQIQVRPPFPVLVSIVNDIVRAFDKQDTGMEISGMKQQMDNRNHLNAQLIQEKTALENNLGSLQAALEARDVELAARTGELNLLKNVVSEMNDANASLECKLAELNKETESLQKSNDTLQADKAAIEGKLVKLKDDNVSLQKSNDTLQADKAALEAKLAELKDEKASLAGKLDEAQKLNSMDLTAVKDQMAQIYAQLISDPSSKKKRVCDEPAGEGSKVKKTKKSKDP